jgi:hypothetical protein
LINVSLSPAEQLIVTGATPSHAVELVTALRGLYQARRGEAVPQVPRIQHDDAIDLVNAFEKLIAPIATALAAELPALWNAWRHSYAAVFDRVARVDNLRAPLPNAATFWNHLLEPFAHHVAAFARHYSSRVFSAASR